MNQKSALVVFVAVLASLLEIIDTSIVNVALPTMMGNLGATLEDISMVITGYAIANAVVLPLSSWLGERIGRRQYYLGCILAFTATSVACGLAPNLLTLTIFRIFQGLMGGALLPTSQALIYEQFPKEKAGTAGAIFGMSVMIGPTLGPVMGGYLTDEYGWRSIFNINLPLGLLAFFVGMTCIFDREKTSDEISAPAKSQGLDTFGLVLLVLGIGCLQFVLERGEAEDWFSSRIILINTCITTICLPLFVWWELKVKNPIINIRLFKQSMVANGVLLMAGLGFFLYSVVFILPIFVTGVFHYTATQTGVLFIPGSILTAMLMPFVGKQMQSGRNPKILIFVGIFFIEVCAWLMTQFSPMTSQMNLLNMLFMRGIGLAFLFVPINSSILGRLRGEELGQVSGLLNLFRQIGGSMGIALIATLFTKNGNQNYLDLITHINPFNSSSQITYQQSLNAFQHKMPSLIGLAGSSKAAAMSIYYRVQGQSFMMSFIQLVYVIMTIFGLTLIPLALIQLKGKATAVVDSH